MGYGKIIFVLLTEVVVLYIGFSLVKKLGNLVFKSFFCRPLEGVIEIEVLASRAILKIYCRLSSKYLAIEDVVESVVERSGLEAKLEVEGL